MIKALFKKIDKFINAENLILILILILGLILRFYKLNWDEQFILHPDEDLGILKPTQELLSNGSI